MTRTTLVLLATLHAASALQALVLGGGFAGLYTALNLAKGGVKTTLVDERERFAFLPLLYDYACGAARSRGRPPSPTSASPSSARP